MKKWIVIIILFGSGVFLFLESALPAQARTLPVDQGASAQPGSQYNPYWIGSLSAGQHLLWAVQGDAPYEINAPLLVGKQVGDYVLFVDTALVPAPYQAMDEFQIVSIDPVKRVVTFTLIASPYLVYDTTVTHPLCLDALTCVMEQ